MKKQIITFGSCMSEGVYAALTRLHPTQDWSYLNHIIHNRSDYFINSFIEKTQSPVGIEDVSDADNDTSPNFPSISLINEGKQFILNQSYSCIGLNGVDWRISFLDNLKSQSVNIILMDNFMDIATRLVRDKITGKCFFIHSASYSPELFSNRFVFTDFLSPEISILNYLKIIDWLSVLQPNTAIYFLPFPSIVHGHQGRDSVIRAADFRYKLVNNPLSIPMLYTLDVEERHMLSIDDWCHYAPSYYLEIAKQILI